MEDVSEVFVEVRKRGCTDLRNPTKKEKEEADELRKAIEKAELNLRSAEAELNKLTDKCAHKLVYDVPGHPYDVRMCYVCGGSLGVV